MYRAKRRSPFSFSAITTLFSGRGDVAQPESAAQIGYVFVPRPGGLSDDFTSDDTVDLKFIEIKAIDGFEVAGALWQPAGKPAHDTTLLILIHGSGLSYKKSPQSALGGRIAAAGYAALGIDTRQHDGAINTDNFFDIRKDIEAAVLTAKALGYRKIVLEGHSLGNIQVQFYAATNWDPEIKAIVLLGAFGNLPWKTRNLLVRDEDQFRQLIGEALDAPAAGTLDKPLPSKMSYYTGRQVAVTAQHFLTYRWDKTSVADGTFWIKRIPLPILMVRDQADGIIQPFEPYMLLDAAHSEGSLVPSIDYVSLPNDRSPSEEGHNFEGNEHVLAETIVAWLQRHAL
jgi:pimeloyl-ACP methyl ester carboxylesterase